MLKRGAFNPNEVELMRLEFVAAWKFVEVDSSLGGMGTADRRKLLVQSVLSVFSDGKREIVEIAHGAIALMRKGQSAATGTHIGSVKPSSRESSPTAASLTDRDALRHVA